jgi:hypothetical protein
VSHSLTLSIALTYSLSLARSLSPSPPLSGSPSPLPLSLHFDASQYEGTTDEEAKRKIVLGAGWKRNKIVSLSRRNMTDYFDVDSLVLQLRPKFGIVNLLEFRCVGPSELVACDFLEGGLLLPSN